LWAVLGLSSLGDWLGLLATSTFAANQVNSSAAKGLAFGSVIAVRLLPALVLGPLAGVFADRFDRRYTMVACDILRFLLFASIPTVGLIAGNPAVVVGWAAVATFIIETAGMAWAPAKDAAVPNLLPRARLEIANQLTLATTYGLTPVLAALALAGLTRTVEEFNPTAHSWANPTNIALWFNALTFLATALVVFFGIKEISGRVARRAREHRPGLLREFTHGWAYVGKTPLVRGLVLGILGAFAGAGVVVGTAQFYARSLGGGDSTFYILFAVLFAGLAGGIVGGPRLVGALSRRRWFGLSIVLAAVSVGVLAIAPHPALAVIAATGVGVGAGMAFLAGTTLLGTEVGDEVRGRVFAFMQTGTRVVLMLAISLSSVLVGLGGSRLLFKVAGLGVALSSTRLLLLAAGVRGLRGRRGRRQVHPGERARRGAERARPGGGDHPRAGRHRCGCPHPRTAVGGPAGRHRADDPTDRSFAVRGGPRAPRRLGGPAGARPQRGGDQRPVCRLVPGLSGRRADSAGRRDLLAVGLGDRWPQARPGRAPRRGPGDRPAPGHRSGRGRRPA
jgi:dTMP kinase